MEKFSPVKILQVCNISPSSQNSSKISLSLAAFDWMFMKLPPMERAFFYPITDHSHSFFHSILIPNLKHSLSLTLQHFLPLAGNLIWPDNSPLPFILYAPNDAVSFAVAETASDFDFDFYFDDHVSNGSHTPQIKNFQHFIPMIEASHSVVPMMAIQVTKFPNDKGFSIGFATHRVLFDGKSFNIFLKSWAHICKLIKMGKDPCFSFPIELAPSFERATHVLQNPFDYFVNPKNRSLKFPSRSTPPSNVLRATFQLSPIHIQKLEKKVLEWMEKTSSPQFYLSKFVVVYAYVLICLIKAKQGKCGGKIHMSFHADARWLLDPPVSSNYIGNCVTFPSMLVEATEFTEQLADGCLLPKIAKKISDLIVELRRTRAIIKNVPKPCSSSFSSNVIKQQHYNHLPGGSVEVCFNVDSPKSKFYETDFGWGKPIKIDVVLEECNSFSLLDTREGDGGVEVGLLLPRPQLDIFASLFFQGLD